MAGNTGRMTVEAIELRGPRMVLWSIYGLKDNRRQRFGFAITREGQFPVPYLHYAKNYAQRYAMSYSIGYLLRLTRGVTRLTSHAPHSRRSLNPFSGGLISGGKHARGGRGLVPRLSWGC